MKMKEKQEGREEEGLVWKGMVKHPFSNLLHISDFGLECCTLKGDAKKISK